MAVPLSEVGGDPPVDAPGPVSVVVPVDVPVEIPVERGSEAEFESEDADDSEVDEPDSVSAHATPCPVATAAPTPGLRPIRRRGQRMQMHPIFFH